MGLTLEQRDAVIPFQEGIEQIFLDYHKLWPQIFGLLSSTMQTPLITFGSAVENFKAGIYNHTEANVVLDQWFSLQLAVKSRLAPVFEGAVAALAIFYEDTVKESLTGQVNDVSEDDLNDNEFMIILAFRVYLAMMIDIPEVFLVPPPEKAK